MEKYNLTKRQILILSNLYSKKTLTSKELALTIGVSIRTIKNEISLLKTKFKDSSLKINSKPSKGYSLIIQDKNILQYLDKLTSTKKQKEISHFNKNNFERVFYILRKLLMTDNYLKLESIADEIYVSKSTLCHDMKEVKNLLSKFDLILNTKPYYGIIVDGSEFNMRLAISEFVYQSDIYYDKNSIANLYKFDIQKDFDLNTIEIILKTVCDYNNIVLLDFSLKSVAIHILITIFRSINNHKVFIPANILEEIQNNDLYKITKTLCMNLQNIFNLNLSEEEIYYIFMHLDGKRLLVSPSHEKEYNKLQEVLDEIFEEININFRMDVSQDKLLRKYLTLHIPQMIKRLRNNIVVRNPIIQENLRKYLYSTKITVSAADIINKHYNVEINLEEFSYLAAYFSMALFNIKKRKIINIGLLRTSSRAESMLYLNELDKSYSFLNYEIRNYFSLKHAEQESEEIDILVTTNKIVSDKFKFIVPIENNDYITKINQITKKIDLYGLEVDKYFKDRFFIANLKGNNKKEVLKNFYDQLVSSNIAYPNRNYDTLFITHEIGNGIVHFQDLHKFIYELCCIVAILEKPILWNNSIVEVIILIKTQDIYDKDIFILCDLFSEWASKKDKVIRFTKNRDYNMFIKDLLDY